MSDTIAAIYADGVFRPLEPVDWPEGTKAEVIAVPESGRPASETSTAWPAGYFEQTAGSLVGEEFERPPQGDLPRREAW
ncbi:MAG TPA: antitoxin family protein [Lacipirellulaceae bacterium]